MIANLATIMKHNEEVSANLVKLVTMGRAHHDELIDNRNALRRNARQHNYNLKACFDDNSQRTR